MKNHTTLKLGRTPRDSFQRKQAGTTRFRDRMEVGDANEGFDSDKRMACLRPFKVSARNCILRMKGPARTQGLISDGLGVRACIFVVCGRQVIWGHLGLGCDGMYGRKGKVV